MRTTIANGNPYFCLSVRRWDHDWDTCPDTIKTDEQMKFTQADIDYLNLLNNTGTDSSNIYLTAQHGYMRNLDRPVLKNLEAIYKSAINPKFTLCYHCGKDVIKMVLALYRELEKNPVASDAPPQEPKKAKKEFKPKPLEAAPQLTEVKIIGEGDE